MGKKPQAYPLENGHDNISLPQTSSIWQKYVTAYSDEISWYKKWLFGPENFGSCTHFLSRWLFLRFLAFIYFIAFCSLWVQIEGLAGTNGILPAEGYLAAIWDKLGIVGYWTFPTLCWFSADTLFLHLLCASGSLFSLLLVCGILPVPSLIGTWTCYLSLSTICRTFLGYQWDTLLLEVGFLAIFFAPNQLLPKFSKEIRPSPCIVWLYYWLLFRLMFSSGVVKLNSGDFTWRTLTALDFHYETQPIPNLMSWYAHQLPGWLQKLSVLSTLIIELIVPFFFLAPRRIRLLAFAGTVLLQVSILCTGNYGFFNLLTIVLCILLLDDNHLKGLFRNRSFTFPTSTNPRSLTAMVASIIVATIVIPLSIIQLKARVFNLELSELEKRLYLWTAPYRSVNSYGLFATMTTSRPEIILEGSKDGREWVPYEFKWKPGDLKRRPSQVAPHQPRIDWQMWFEALNYQRGQKPTLWFKSFISRLLEGEHAVLRLLGHNPFSDSPPRYIRAVVYDYQFTDKKFKRKSGNWWKRDFLGIYVHPSSLGR